MTQCLSDRKDGMEFEKKRSAWSRVGWGCFLLIFFVWFLLFFLLFFFCLVGLFLMFNEVTPMHGFDNI